MAIRTYFCDVAVGESIDNLLRINVPVPTSVTTLYSGRAFQIDANGRASEGITTPFNPAYVAHRGVDCADVRGAKAILSTQTGSLPADYTGNSVISGIMMQAGLVILTTEYHTTGSYGYMDPITCVTGNGKFKEAGGDSNDETIGFALAEGSNVNAAYASTRSLLKIQFTRSGYGL
jgi:hypothetical protein